MEIHDAIQTIPGGMDTLVYGGAAVALAGLAWLAKKTKTKWDDRIIGIFRKVLPMMRRKR